MTWNVRPLAVTILGWLYLVVGTCGFVFHLTELDARSLFRYDGVWVELVEVLAIACGIFLLRGRNWARWLAIAWMAFHVGLSALEAFRGFALHCLFGAVIAWLLFRPDATRYFRGESTGQKQESKAMPQ
jgi:hypothetical protein